MCSPVGHALAALAVGVTQNRQKLNWQFALFCVFSGNAADLDFLVGWALADINRYHHLGSHSITAAFIYGIIIFLVTRTNSFPGINRSGVPALIWAITGGTAYLSHILLDMFAVDGTLPAGMQLLWPLSSEFFIASWTPFRSFLHDTSGGDMWAMISGLFSGHNLLTVLLEIAIILPLLIFAQWSRSRSIRNQNQ